MKADAQLQERLLDVQTCDTKLAQLLHRERNLPQAQALAETQRNGERVHDAIVLARVAASDLATEVARVEADVQQVRDRMARDQQLLDSGEIGDPKQLSSLQHEMTSLERRRSDLEDAELEVMERQEVADQAVAALQVEEEQLQVQAAALTSEVEELLAQIAVERAAIEAERDQLAAAIPGELLALYEKVRADHDGVGAAPLYRGRCEGCRLQLPPQEIELVKAAAADEVLRCEECRRILVRTAESGL